MYESNKSSLSYGWIEAQTGVSYFGMATGLGAGKLRIKRRLEFASYH